ncbi:SRPBCC domain-containing protein [Cognatiyoonia sp. IB215446]|uniref:SRPBCC family protein n=1 Tax=Cognatiyoonia sp. IB215446 TaxID=3097355 RepID=UPI002A126B3C|nr:SRPBCC domain-containing protein [Cognatiyoonia sp. IB215446]MDX8349198.1 SRPBCC domain-containing protein [Cognatiyoonia sp. IB215446]
MTTKTKVEGDTLTVERLYDASQSSVFDAWIDAAKTTHWWGCGQTTKVVSTIEQEKDGCYQHLMTIDGHGEYLIDGRLMEYKPPELLSYTMPGVDGGADMAVHVTFTAVGDQTKVTLVQSPVPDFLQDTVVAGWTASFERLANFFTGARRAA